MALRKPLFLDSFGANEVDPANDTITLAGLTISSATGIDMGGFGITNLATPSAATDAASKSYVDSVATGLDLKASVRVATAAALPAVTPAGTGVGHTLTADANGALTVDGVAVAVGNRVLVKDQVAADDNGIYVVTATGDGSNPFILTRATDADQNAEVTAGMFTFVAEGTANADTGWVLVTNDAIVVDTTALTFSQFSSATALTYDAGLVKTGASVNVELDTGAGAQTTGADGGSSGLEFDTSGAAGKLRAKVDPAGGVQRGASGLLLELDDTPNTLDVDADGLKVVGLPSLFLINDVATSANVTAANLGTLTAGTGSNGDGLHRHALLEVVYNVDAAVAAGDPIYFTSNNEVSSADAAAGTNSGFKVFGVARTAQGTPGSPTTVVLRGPCPGVLTGATAGNQYYLASGGGLTATQPSGNVDVVLAGFAINATDLLVQPQYLSRRVS